jgi:hypothetical protein
MIFQGMGTSTVRVMLPTLVEKRTWLAARTQFTTLSAPSLAYRSPEAFVENITAYWHSGLVGYGHHRVRCIAEIPEIQNIRPHRVDKSFERADVVMLMSNQKTELFEGRHSLDLRPKASRKPVVNKWPAFRQARGRGQHLHVQTLIAQALHHLLAADFVASDHKRRKRVGDNTYSQR